MARDKYFAILEMDVTDMFWQIAQNEAIDAVSWAMALCRLRKLPLWFSIDKASEKTFDTVGKSSESNFVLVNEKQVERFAAFDMVHNRLFTSRRVVLAQGLKGVPIRGVISAQMAEI